jgi:SAM-dependent methyltransferase
MKDLSLETFIKVKEKECGGHTTGKAKWMILDKMVPRLDIPKGPVAIDAGGECVTAHIIRRWFPDVDIMYTVNMADFAGTEELSKYVRANLEQDNLSRFIDKKADIIFLMDVIEHLYDPDRAMVNLLGSLNHGGYLVISTPNLADIFNRLFLLFGLSLHNYNVSQWYKTGNPAIRDLSGKRHGNHKSVFTVSQLMELLKKVYHLEICDVRGYSYYERDWLQYYDKNASLDIRGEKNYHFQDFIRKAMSRVLPTSMAEGMLVVARK